MITEIGEFERSGLLVGARFLPDGTRDESRSLEMLGPGAAAFTRAIDAERQQRADKRAARLREIEAMRPGSAGKVYARITDALGLAKARIEADEARHRQPSERDQQLASKLSIEAGLLWPRLTEWDHERGHAHADAREVAEAIESDPRVKTWQTEAQKYGADSRAPLEAHNPYSRIYATGVLLEAATDLCGRLYDEAANL